MVIAIDGPAGVGKSTIAKEIAKETGYFYLNSGNFYRAISLAVIENNINPKNRKKCRILAEELDIKIINGKFYLNDRNIDNLIGSETVGMTASIISVDPEIRNIVNKNLKKTAKNMNIICEGRDITTVVFPEAEYKFYFDAQPEIRAQRRFDQHPEDADYDSILKKILERDENDKNKPVGSLKIASDAEYIDTSYLTIKAVCAKVLTAIKNKSKNDIKGSGEAKVSEEREKVELENTEMQSQLQEEYLKSLDGIEDGQLVTGTVIQVNSEYVFVDVGYKSEGRIARSEFNETPEEGDQVNVLIVNKEGRGGQIVISKKRADVRARMDELKVAADEKTPVAGKFVKSIKGGFEVDLGSDFLGFCPLSKADIVRTENPESLIGVSDYFIIEKFHSGYKLKSVVSRREYLEKRIKENKEQFFSSVHIGDVVEGTVKSFTSFGAFIDLGGFDGLLHINDMSWGHVIRPRDYVKKGEKVQLRLINIDPETQKINLSLKHMQEDPWESFEDRFNVNDVIKAPVTKLTSFGVFIEIEPGIEGLAHISELSWTKRINHPKEILSVGDVVEAKILGYDLDKKRVSLGLKQLQDNPWDTIDERYPVGKVLSKPVVKVTNSGAFINLEEGIDGFLHVDDISWTKKVKSMNAFCKEGDVVEVSVIKVDSANRRIRLGVKQLEDNPWQKLKKDYPRFSVISGSVSSVTDFGVFVKVPGEIEGLIPKFNLVGPDEQYTDEVLKKFKEGDPIKAMVMDINTSQQKLSLSIKEMIKRSQQSEIEKYMQGSEDDSDTVTFADLIAASREEK